MHRARVVLAALCLVLAMPMAAHADEGDDGGGRQDNRRCQGDQCRGSFSPGPFDRSPVDVSRNQFCIGPNSCPGQQSPPPQKDQQPKAIPACPPTLPVLPHCDPAPTPKSLLPPNPKGLVAAAQAMTKGIGEAAGALAGAIVGGIGGIFL